MYAVLQNAVMDDTLSDFMAIQAQGVCWDDILYNHQLQQIRRPELPLCWSWRLGQRPSSQQAVITLWHTDNNLYSHLLRGNSVVNCFRNFYLWHTDNNERKITHKRQKVVNCFRNFYLWHTDNNTPWCCFFQRLVVNCFRNFYLWHTDNNSLCLTPTKQVCCELLSKFLSLTHW